MARGRDNQKNKCYAWERAATGGTHYKQSLTLEQAEEMVRKIWRKERGRYGLAGTTAPLVESKHHGYATASSSHKLRFPKWALNEWVVLHEMAHRLTPTGEAHGPRFVGVLIGLVCRYFDQDRDVLLEKAYDMGLRVDVRAIGAIPERRLSDRVMLVLPGTPTGIAVALNIRFGMSINFRQVRGAAIRLVSDGRARWKNNVLVRLK